MSQIDNEMFSVSLGRLTQLERDSKDLTRANALIDRLRAENAALKMEREKFFGVVERCRRALPVSGNAHKKWAVSYVLSQLRKNRLV